MLLLKVIEDAPLVCDEAFIAKHNIHLVACEDKYFDDPTDK